MEISSFRHVLSEYVDRYGYDTFNYQEWYKSFVRRYSGVNKKKNKNLQYVTPAYPQEENGDKLFQAFMLYQSGSSMPKVGSGEVKTLNASISKDYESVLQSIQKGDNVTRYNALQALMTIITLSFPQRILKDVAEDHNGNVNFQSVEYIAPLLNFGGVFAKANDEMRRRIVSILMDVIAALNPISMEAKDNLNSFDNLYNRKEVMTYAEMCRFVRSKLSSKLPFLRAALHAFTHGFENTGIIVDVYRCIYQCMILAPLYNTIASFYFQNTNPANAGKILQYTVFGDISITPQIRSDENSAAVDQLRFLFIPSVMKAMASIMQLREDFKKMYASNLNLISILYQFTELCRRQQLIIYGFENNLDAANNYVPGQSVVFDPDIYWGDFDDIDEYTLMGGMETMLSYLTSNDIQSALRTSSSSSSISQSNIIPNVGDTKLFGVERSVYSYRHYRTMVKNAKIDKNANVHLLDIAGGASYVSREVSTLDSEWEYLKKMKIERSANNRFLDTGGGGGARSPVSDQELAYESESLKPKATTTAEILAALRSEIKLTPGGNKSLTNVSKQFPITSSAPFKSQPVGPTRILQRSQMNRPSLVAPLKKSPGQPSRRMIDESMIASSSGNGVIPLPLPLLEAFPPVIEPIGQDFLNSPQNKPPQLSPTQLAAKIGEMVNGAPIIEVGDNARISKSKSRSSSFAKEQKAKRLTPLSPQSIMQPVLLTLGGLSVAIPSIITYVASFARHGVPEQLDPSILNLASQSDANRNIISSIINSEIVQQHTNIATAGALALGIGGLTAALYGGRRIVSLFKALNQVISQKTKDVDKKK